MATFRDLTEYSYARSEPGVLNVGWLGAESEFMTADPSPEFLRALVRGAFEDHNVMRGLQNCNFCDLESGGFGVLIDDDGSVRYWDKSIIEPPAWLGTGEIRVTSEKGVTYAAPTLVVHYVLDHHYAPPEEFVEAMLYQFGDQTAAADPAPGDS